MTDQRFDALAKSLGRATSRRSVLKALAAGALGGVLARVDRRSADAATKHPACARINEPCSASAPCCAGAGICSEDAENTCCKPLNTTCLSDSDCCIRKHVCRKKTQTSLRYCLELATFGGPCATSQQCAAGLDCDPKTSTCLLQIGGACTSDDDCASRICDEYAGVCVDCHPDGDPCNEGADCCSGICNIGINQCVTL